MCGIVGYIGKPDQPKLDRLVWESTVRGLHNLGQQIEDNAGVYHARYCTSGGDHQPIYRNGRCLVFNGVIDMGTKAEMEERHELDLDTDNDGELALAVPDEMITAYTATDFKDGLVAFVDDPKITFAGLIIDKNTKELIALRNVGRPLWKYEDIDCIYLGPFEFHRLPRSKLSN
jgi:asparagine synthetase B (glutamine-hydrolysing)